MRHYKYGRAWIHALFFCKIGTLALLTGACLSPEKQEREVSYETIAGNKEITADLKLDAVQLFKP